LKVADTEPVLVLVLEVEDVLVPAPPVDDTFMESESPPPPPQACSNAMEITESTKEILFVMGNRFTFEGWDESGNEVPMAWISNANASDGISLHASKPTDSALRFAPPPSTAMNAVRKYRQIRENEL
jgi:hypothetical protein